MSAVLDPASECRCLEAQELAVNSLVTSVPRNDLERRLVEAAERQRRFASDELAALLGGFRIEATVDPIGGATPQLVAVGPEVARLLDTEVLLDSVLAVGDLSTADFAFADPKSVTARALQDAVRRPSLGGLGALVAQPQRVLDALAAGSTLIMNSLGARSIGGLRSLEELIAASLGRWPQTNAYLSDGYSEGFGVHWDDHDVLVIQTAGRKYWEIRAPFALAPLRGPIANDAFGATVWSGILSVGDALYIPRGWGHEVYGLERELSLHMTIGFKGPTGVDYLDSWVGSGAPPDRSSRPTLDAVLSGERARMQCSIRTGPISWRGHLRNLGSGTKVKGRFVSGAVFPDYDQQLSRPALAAYGTVVSFDPDRIEFMCALLDGTERDFSDLREIHGCRSAGCLERSILELGRYGMVEMAS